MNHRLSGPAEPAAFARRQVRLDGTQAIRVIHPATTGRRGPRPAAAHVRSLARRRGALTPAPADLTRP